MRFFQDDRCPSAGWWTCQATNPGCGTCSSRRSSRGGEQLSVPPRPDEHLSPRQWVRTAVWSARRGRWRVPPWCGRQEPRPAWPHRSDFRHRRPRPRNHRFRLARRWSNNKPVSVANSSPAEHQTFGIILESVVVCPIQCLADVHPRRDFLHAQRDRCQSRTKLNQNETIREPVWLSKCCRIPSAEECTEGYVVSLLQALGIGQ